ncbi:MAG TPA: hypothetical protein VHR86_08875, partial [Armatimonadota bacterium]|nr:hypothetical protein [Armatimonadota bacterium]
EAPAPLLANRSGLDISSTLVLSAEFETVFGARRGKEPEWSGNGYTARNHAYIPLSGPAFASGEQHASGYSNFPCIPQKFAVFYPVVKDNRGDFLSFPGDR